MTTILADHSRGVMVSDSNVSDGDRSWSRRKVFRVRGALVGVAGTLSQTNQVVEWYRAGAGFPGPAIESSAVLVLRPDGLWLYDDTATRLHRVARGIEAIGTGGGYAMAAYEGMDYADPQRAVRIAIKHDANSRARVRIYKL